MEFADQRYAGLGERIPWRDLVPSPPHAASVWRRNARVFSKLWKGALLPQFLDPLFYLVAFGFALGTYFDEINGVPYRDFIAPGLIASAAMWSASFETTYNVYVRMNETRLYDNTLSTPVEVPDLVAGDLAWSSTRAAVYGTTFLAVAAALGLVDSWWALLIPAGITPMFLFSGIFFPFDDLPGWVEVVAWFTPLYHLVEITRGLADGPEALWILVHTAWLLGVSALLFPIPVRALRARLVA